MLRYLVHVSIHLIKGFTANSTFKSSVLFLGDFFLGGDFLLVYLILGPFLLGDFFLRGDFLLVYLILGPFLLAVSTKIGVFLAVNLILGPFLTGVSKE